MEPFKNREDFLEVPPPEAWDGVVRRIRRHERWRRIRQGGLGGIVIAVLIYGIISFGPWSSRVETPNPQTAEWAEVESRPSPPSLQRDRQVVETALHELELMQKQFPQNTVIRSRWASIQQKAQAWTRLTSAGVWR